MKNMPQVLVPAIPSLCLPSSLGTSVIARSLLSNREGEKTINKGQHGALGEGKGTGGEEG